nr:unnamed protein product [Spirometra erinaceieuropaei]
MVSDKTDKLSCNSEAIWLTIKAPGSPSLDILTVYRPPRNDPTADARLIEDLERFSLRSEVLIMGDFNAPLIDWSSAYASGPDHAFDRRLLGMTFKLFLTQHVSFPTRVREGQQSNCLDLLLTKSLDSVDEVQCLPPLGRSDHVVLLWDYSIFSLPEQATRVRRNIWRGDFAQMKAELNTINWESAFSGDIIKDWDWFNRWTREVDGSNAVYAVYVDFKKAFDSVPHQRLLHKLNRTGLRGNLLRWIQSFLIGRSQIVHVGDRQSAEVAVESGVPQGSVLGSTLFIIYVNDCVSELNCDVAMFADDVKLWSVIRTEFDEEHLQADLTRLEKWSQDWLLPFNVTKCNVLRVGRTRSLNRRVYHLNGVPLQEVDAQKDLGVWVTASLKPSLHCSKVAKSAMSVLYLVKRAFSTFDEDCFVKVFRTFVRPQLEFAIQAWKPWTSKDLSILEKVQRRATKLVSGQGSLPYDTRLSNLGLFPLSYRQLRGDLIQTFRILRGQDCCLVPTDFFELATTTDLRGHPLKLRVTGAKLDTRKFFFSNRVIEAWNALPAGVVMSTSVEAFKRNLDQIATNRHNAT